MLYKIEVIGQAPGLTSHDAGVVLTHRYQQNAENSTNTSLFAQFHLQGFNLHMKLSRPNKVQPGVYINDAKAVGDGSHLLYAGDRIMVPALDLMLLVFGSDRRGLKCALPWSKIMG